MKTNLILIITLFSMLVACAAPTADGDSNSNSNSKPVEAEATDMVIVTLEPESTPTEIEAVAQSDAGSNQAEETPTPQMETTSGEITTTATPTANGKANTTSGVAKHDPEATSTKPRPSLPDATATSSESPPPAVVTPAPDFAVGPNQEMIQLQVGQKTLLQNNLEVTFLNVVEDNRCPSDVDCEWAGEVIVLLGFKENGQSLEQVTLASVSRPIQKLKNYSVELFEVGPPPVKIDEKLSESAYAITLIIRPLFINPKEGPTVIPPKDDITPTPKADQGQIEKPFELKVGQQINLADKLEVTLVDILQDSRCPPDVNCVWSGEVVISLAIKENGQSLDSLELATVNARVAKVSNYTIELLSVSPPPAKSTEQLATSAYIVTLQIK